MVNKNDNKLIHNLEISIVLISVNKDNLHSVMTGIVDGECDDIWRRDDGLLCYDSTIMITYDDMRLDDIFLELYRKGMTRDVCHDRLRTKIGSVLSVDMYRRKVYTISFF